MTTVIKILIRNLYGAVSVYFNKKTKFIIIVTVDFKLLETDCGVELDNVGIQLKDKLLCSLAGERNLDTDYRIGNQQVSLINNLYFDKTFFAFRQ